MTTATDIVTKSVHVRVPVDVAWRVFTEEMHRWWPLATHSLAAEHDATPDAMVLEGRVGGRLYETLGGDQRTWGTIMTWDPPSELAVDWTVHADAELATRWTATFSPEDGGTRVDLVHVGFAALGADAERTRASYGGDDGWTAVLAAYVIAADVSA